MARVPNYQQGSLASELTGIPQVDNSTAVMLNQVQNASQAIGNTLDALAVDAQREIRAREQEQAALLKAQRKAVVEVQAASLSTEFLLRAKNHQHELDKDSALGGQTRFTNHAQWVEEDSRALVADIPDDDLRLEVAKRLGADKEALLKDYQNRTFQQEAEESRLALDGVTDAMIVQAGSISDPMELQKHLESTERLFTAQLWAHGDKGFENLNKAQKSMVDNALWNILDENPQQVLSILASGQFDQYLSGKEKNGWRSAVLSRQRQINSAAKLGIQLTGVQSVTPIVMADLDGHIDPQAVQHALAKVRKVGGGTPIQRAYLENASARAITGAASGSDGFKLPNINAKGKPLFVFDKNSPLDEKDQFQIRFNEEMVKLFGGNPKTGKYDVDLEEAVSSGRIQPAQIDLLNDMILYGKNHKLFPTKNSARTPTQDIARLTTVLQSQGKYFSPKQRQAAVQASEIIIGGLKAKAEAAASIFKFNPFGNAAQNKKAQNKAHHKLNTLVDQYEKKFGKPPTGADLKKLTKFAQQKAL